MLKILMVAHEWIRMLILPVLCIVTWPGILRVMLALSDRQRKVALLAAAQKWW